MVSATGRGLRRRAGRLRARRASPPWRCRRRRCPTATCARDRSARARSSRARAVPVRARARPARRHGPRPARAVRSARPGSKAEYRTGCRSCAGWPGPTSAVGSSPSSAASASASPTSLTLPAGMPAAPIRSIQPAMSAVASRLLELGDQLVAVLDPGGVRREARVAGQLGRADHVRRGAPTAGRCRRRSRAGRREHGTRRRARSTGGGCRGGAVRMPVARYDDAWLASEATALDSRLTSTCWPRPVRSRCTMRGEHAHDDVLAGEQVDDGDAHLHRLAAGLTVGLAGDAHRARRPPAPGSRSPAARLRLRCRIP